MATDRLGSITAFIRVAELGGFAAAGRSLGISASAVSKSVSRLEERLQLRLFQRTTRSLAMTEDGKLFFERCSAILKELDQAEADMLQRADRPSGLLRIEMPTALGRLRIIPMLENLTSRFPELRIAATFADTLTDPISAGIDAVVRIGYPRDPRLMVKRVGMVKYITCASPTYLAVHGEPRTLEDLVQHDCVRRVSHDPPGFAPWRFKDTGTGEPLERSVQGTLSCDSPDAMVDFGLSGSGLVQLHTYMAERHIASGKLVEVLAPFAGDGPPISILFPSSKNLAPKVRAFIEFVTQVLNQRPDA
ncbi:LysR substrate-binding domain-containing protein [Rhizobium sp. NPDC090275]|uniref:LysR family transcriptional regulator n=1 Tax=Rhizobium sp. NPDC090275 TaxID=3364498 RepID=UPI00383BD61A